MPEIEIINKDNKSVGKAELPADIFGVKVNEGLLHEVVRNHLANKRQGNASTKTKGQVRGGGRKPHKQKGSGRARAGSTRSPLWRGGGIVFGPQPRSYAYTMPKKAKWSALNSALAAKYSDGDVLVIDDLTVKEPKTKNVMSILAGLGLKGSILMVIPEKDVNLELAVRNIPSVHVARVGELNVYSVLSHNNILVAKDAVEKMKEAYLG